jgi:hypothetical protein
MGGTARLMRPGFDLPPTWAYSVVTRTVGVATDVLALTLAGLSLLPDNRNGEHYPVKRGSF